MASQEKLHTYLKQVVLELEKTRRRLREVEMGAREPIAIVGMACRYPGGLESPADLWSAVAEGRDLISEWPSDRGWYGEPYFDGESQTSRLGAPIGGFLADVSAFDAEFFGLSSSEALAMHPHQRLALECAWEAFERGGIDPSSVRGSDTGVFLGVTSIPYETLGEGVDGDSPLMLAGHMTSMAAGRISYLFGLEGPAMALDTACSSSLVAIHQAVGSLRSGECSMALAGGAAIMMSPPSFFALAQGMASASDARCKSFSASADGAGWGEGLGLLLLERLSDARRNQHPVWAVVRGSAVKHDGASNAPQAPNGLAQQRIIRRALQNAGLEAAEVDVVEAHSPGTPVGDLVEAEALMATYGQHRPEGRPLWLGSLKSNTGHTLAAAGVGSVIKMVEAMRHRTIPLTLHVNEPTPYVDWASGRIQLATETQEWPRPDNARRAAISGVGMGGVNAHIIIEEAVEEPMPVGQTALSDSGWDAASPVVPWIITAKSPEALLAQAARTVAHLEDDPDLRAIDIGYSLASTRAQFAHRAIVVGRDRNELLNGVRSLVAGESDPAVVRGVAEPSAKTAAFFHGEGAHWLGMGRQLYSIFPVYAKAIDETCEILSSLMGTPVRDLLFASADSEKGSLLRRPSCAQPALFAVETALYRLAQSWGFHPDVVMGCSAGEIAAGHAAGLWSLQDACALVVESGRLRQSMGDADTTAVSPAAELYAIPPLGASERSANGASGNHTGAQSSDGQEATSTEHQQASSADALRAGLFKLCERLDYRLPDTPIVSAHTGTVVDPSLVRTPEYWVEQLISPVHLKKAIRRARSREDITTFLQIGPGVHPAAMIHGIFEDADGSSSGVVIPPLLQPGTDEDVSFVSGLATAYANGAPIDWAGVYRGAGARRVPLPTYAFQRTRLWLDAQGGAGLAGAVDARASAGPVHDGAPVCTEIERTVAAAIGQVLGIAQVSRDDGFLALGGDSVSAMRLAARVRAEGLPLTPELLFEHATVRQVAAALEEAANQATDCGAPGCLAADRQFEAMSVSGLSSAELAALPGLLAMLDQPRSA
ncbi:type I polyketide synthase [Mycobacterium marinum]|uniref:type I polyketide synthase n=1 Tax=Mycobacterium marinum TaxID=1781 RepID=UPI0019223837|nr:type I polyketide synthase [Mycobacterium marinum]QQW33596.1 acyltransferase domain-containing protein [Mycobacterium marinum]